MSDDHEPKKRTVFFTFDQALVFVTPRRTVGLRFDSPPAELGLAPHLVPGIELTPEEARRLAQALQDKAALAEAGSPQA
jgi:hypothetical protein